jgi:predicted naringenin-chalcone synthase
MLVEQPSRHQMSAFYMPGSLWVVSHTVNDKLYYFNVLSPARNNIRSSVFFSSVFTGGYASLVCFAYTNTWKIKWACARILASTSALYQGRHSQPITYLIPTEQDLREADTNKFYIWALTCTPVVTGFVTMLRWKAMTAQHCYLWASIQLCCSNMGKHGTQMWQGPFHFFFLCLF